VSDAVLCTIDDGIGGAEDPIGDTPAAALMV
jgi:hypothetical protein